MSTIDDVRAAADEYVMGRVTRHHGGHNSMRPKGTPLIEPKNCKACANEAADKSYGGLMRAAFIAGAIAFLRHPSTDDETWLLVRTEEPVTDSYIAMRVAEACERYGALRPGESVSAGGSVYTIEDKEGS